MNAATSQEILIRLKDEKKNADLRIIQFSWLRYSVPWVSQEIRFYMPGISVKKVSKFFNEYWTCENAVGDEYLEFWTYDSRSHIPWLTAKNLSYQQISTSQMGHALD